MNRVILLLASALTLGAQNAVFVDLRGEWRQSPDDQAVYARPDFDDRQWTTIVLPWQERPPDGVRWLRRSVDLPEGAAGMPLALTLGPVSPLHQVYVNGLKIGGHSEAHPARTRLYPIPAAAVSARLTIAIRTESFFFGIQPLTIFAGGLYQITDLRSAEAGQSTDVLAQQRIDYSSQLAMATLLFAFAFLLGLLWLAARDRPETLWLGLLVAIRAHFDWRSYQFLRPDAVPFSSHPLNRLSEIALLELCFAAVSLPIGWFRPVAWALGIGLLFLPPEEARSAQHGLRVAAMAVLLWGWWRNGGPRQPVMRHLIPGTLALLVLTRVNSASATLFPVFFLFAGHIWSVQSVTTAVFATILTTLLVVSLAADRREKQRLASELEAARGVQQLLVSGTRSQAGYEVDAVYEPAQEVGGDFYQVRPAANGDLVVVAGDVSGKGLKAALVVSMMAGVVRSHLDHSPAAILAAMNRALGEGSGGFVTAIALRFSPSGEFTLANAGHLPPYRSGVEIPVEPGLPLGVALDAEYAEARVRMEPGESLTLLTDGIVEAANAQGELFGFERTVAISTKFAREIAAAAKAWGQNDDITVVTVRRSG